MEKIDLEMFDYVGNTLAQFGTKNLKEEYPEPIILNEKELKIIQIYGTYHMNIPSIVKNIKEAKYALKYLLKKEEEIDQISEELLKEVKEKKLTDKEAKEIYYKLVCLRAENILPFITYHKEYKVDPKTIKELYNIPYFPSY